MVHLITVVEDELIWNCSVLRSFDAFMLCIILLLKLQVI